MLDKKYLKEKLSEDNDFDVMSEISSQPELKVLSYFKDLYRSGYKWRGTHYTSNILYNQCWSAARISGELERAVSFFFDDDFPSRRFVSSCLNLLYSHWHNFLLVQMRESLSELYHLLLFSEGKIDERQLRNYLITDLGYSNKYVDLLLERGSDTYEMDYFERNIIKRGKSHLANRDTFSERIGK